MASPGLFNKGNSTLVPLTNLVAVRSVDDPGLSPTATIYVGSTTSGVTTFTATNETGLIAEVQEAVIKYVRGVGWSLESYVDIP